MALRDSKIRGTEPHTYMLTALVVVFVLAYAAIALEHPLGINKSASALIGAGLLWTIYALGGQHSPLEINRELG